MLRIDELTVVTMDADRRILTDAAIVIEDDRIAAVGRGDDLAEQFPDAEHQPGSGMVAIPGLIDAHCHADQSLLRGLGDCMRWVPFLDDVVEPYLVKRDPADGVLANTLSMVEMLKNGTTCFVSPNVDPRDDYAAMTSVVGQLGIRAVLGRFTMPAPLPDDEVTAKQTVDAAVEVMRRWHKSENGLVDLWFGLMVPRVAGDTVHPEFYKAVQAASHEMGVGIVYHFCSEIEDSDYIVDAFGIRPAEWSRDHHALGSNVLLINGCQMTPEEIQILAETGTQLVHSPVANMKMATGILPLRDVLDAGIKVSLGTDGALNNNSYDMFAEMKTAILLANAMGRRADVLTAQEALEMATIHGAHSIGREDELGSIEVGKLADIALVDLRKPSSVPVHDVISNLVFSANGSHVDTVFVAGRKVVASGKVLGVDEDDVLARARERAAIVREQLDAKVANPWPVS